MLDYSLAKSVSSLSYLHPVMAKSFTLFPTLPVEIRVMIWKSYLSYQPIDLGGTVTVFTPTYYRQLQNFHTRGDPIYVQAPMPAALLVNREAREAATAWAGQNDLQLHFCQETQGHVYIRKWTPMSVQNPVYIPPESWDWIKSLLDSEEINDDYDSIANYWLHVVFPAETAYWRGDLAKYFVDTVGPTIISIYWGDLPEYRYARFSPAGDRHTSDHDSPRRKVEVQTTLKAERIDYKNDQWLQMRWTTAFEDEDGIAQWTSFSRKEAAHEIHRRIDGTDGISAMLVDVLFFDVRITGMKKFGELNPVRKDLYDDDFYGYR